MARRTERIPVPHREQGIRRIRSAELANLEPDVESLDLAP